MISREMNSNPKLLINQPLLALGRNANTAWFGFGKWIQDLAGEAEYCSMALHFQCPWRIVDKEKRKIVLASSDVYEPNSATNWANDFDWDVQGANLFDEKSQIWIDATYPLHVADIKINMWGDCKLLFSNGDVLSTYSSSSSDSECWRFFEEGGKAHFVMTGQGAFSEYETD